MERLTRPGEQGRAHQSVRWVPANTNPPVRHPLAIAKGGRRIVRGVGARVKFEEREPPNGLVIRTTMVTHQFVKVGLGPKFVAEYEHFWVGGNARVGWGKCSSRA